jgi:hypothetical protein
VGGFMNIPTSNTRGFFEILMPGIFLLINTCITICLFVVLFIPNSAHLLSNISKSISSSALIITFLVVFGYLIGFVLRLLKNEKIDQISASIIKTFKKKYRSEYFLKDRFFYGRWMNDKITNRLPNAAKEFYKEFWGDKYTDDGVVNTTFINFCKTIILKFDPQTGNEVFNAEALCRFVAGSYYALIFSIYLMVLNILIVVFKISPIASLVPIFICVGYFVLLVIIVTQYRFLRCKEVDTVFFACYANKEIFEKLFPDDTSRHKSQRSHKLSLMSTEYNLRKQLLINIYGLIEKEDRKVNAVKLDELISAMKDGSDKHSFLSSLYFAGSEVDHPFFLDNDKIAIGIAVLPEDSDKAGLRKRHPHQIEYIVVLQGSIIVNIKKIGITFKKTLYTKESFIIKKNVCHWTIINKDCDNAAYLFVKTNPSQEPREKGCGVTHESK